MFDTDGMLELAQAEDEAHFRGDLVLSLPKGSYTTEEIWDILMECSAPPSPSRTR